MRLAVTLLLPVILTVGCSSTGFDGGGSKDQALKDHINLGLNYLKEGNRQMARTHLRRAMEIDSRSAGAHHAMALLLQAELENELAEKHYRKAISYDRNFTRARNNYAIFLFRQQRYDDAYQQLKEAGEDINYRNRFRVFYSLGIAANMIDKSEAARAAWEKAIALSPSFALPYLELGKLYFEQGNVVNARKYLEAFDTLAKPQAASLWLAVRIADHSGDRDAVASKGLALEKLFPKSEESRLYEAWLNNDANKR